MKIAAVAVLAFVLSGCSAKLLTPEERQVQFIETTKVNKAQAYERALAYFGKTFGDSNSAIKVRSPASSQIIAKGNVACNVLRQAGDTNDYVLDFSLDLQAKDKKIRLSFEDLVIKHGSGASVGQPVQWDYNQLSSVENREKIKECLEPLRKGVTRALAGTQSDW